MKQQPSATEIAMMILAAPAWAKVGITVPNERLREHSALKLGRIITGEDEHDDDRQLSLL
jgi:hypothetical protein